MPQAVSRRQYRMMMAILHGKEVKDGPRGRPPKSVAAKYVGSDTKDLPEQSGQDRGGSWNEHHHAKAKERVKHGREERKKERKAKKAAGRERAKHLKKAFEDYYKGRAVGAIVMDSQGRILMGHHESGGLATPGGHVEPYDESFDTAVLRELKEETGLTGANPQKVWEGRVNGNTTQVYLVDSVRGKMVPSEELSDLRWIEPHEIPWDKMRDCCVEPLEHVISTKLGKSLKGMMAMENLQKNIIRDRGNAVFEVTHGDALKLVGNGLFRLLREAVRGMDDESFKDVHIDTYTLSIRKHMNDVYSGRVNDGHKVVYQFTNKSLPELTAGLMSVFEWYLPEDAAELELLDESALQDDAIHGGINELMNNYRRHNIGNIYHEMETIREQIRNGAAIDLQQVEARVMKLFDKLEDTLHEVVDKHNQLAEEAGNEIDSLEARLRELAFKIEEMGKKPETVEAFSANPANPHKVHDDSYPYLPKPHIEISPNGKIRIMFGHEWTPLEKENFLKDMRAKVIGKSNAS